MVPRVEQRAGATPGWVDSWKSGELVIILRYSDNDCRTWNIRLRWCCKPWCKAWKIIPDRAWLIRSKGECCVEDTLRMVSLEELQNTSLCWRSNRTIAHKWQRGWLLGYCHLWQYPTTNCGLVEASLIPQLVAWLWDLLSPLIAGESWP